MGTLAFFPWLDIKRELIVGPIHLVPYRRDVLPGGDEQAVIDKVTEPYMITRRSSIGTATLFRYARRGILADIAETELTEVFVLASLATAAGLSARRFFGLMYWNRDNFVFFVQRFTAPDRGVLFQARRLDGSTGVYVPHENLIVGRPIHAGSGGPTEFDEPLLHSYFDFGRMTIGRASGKRFKCSTLPVPTALNFRSKLPSF